MLRHRTPVSRWTIVALLLSSAGLAFDDNDFCIAAQQLALAAQKDVGVWLDRQTRNAGMTISCESRLIEFERFTYAPSQSMNEAWRQRSAAEWSAIHCNSALWADAIRSGWRIVLVVTSADRNRVLLSAQCG